MIIPEDKRPEPMLEYLLKENIEMKKILVDVWQKLEPISNNTINSNNNVVNINMFLNEQCKDAMNVTEFIESIQLSLEDMMNIATTGQTQGMTSILIDRLSSLDVLKRPLHCSDLKKETIYIKDEDKWEQDSKTKPKMKSVLDKLTKKGIDAMPMMEDDPDSYVKTITEVIKEPREDKKIINSVIKEILINRTNFDIYFTFWVLFGAISPGVIAFTLYAKAQKYLGASITGFTLYLYTIYAAIYGIIFFGELLQNFHYLGASLVLIGVYFAKKT